jgi:ribonuclease HII
VGVDEAGRGCLAGPLVVAAVSFAPHLWSCEEPWMNEIQDSKKVSEKRREVLFEQIKAKASFAESLVISSQEIDRLNVLRASLEGFRRLIVMANSKSFWPEVLLVDGNQKVPGLAIEQRAIVSGDSFSKSIAAASIVAKVTRDRLMKNLAFQYPVYEFDKHKGYGTKIHIEALKVHGPCEIHRKTFIPKSLKRSSGADAEDLVQRFLENQGFQIVNRNWKCKMGEIDLIAQKNDELHFFEVRKRSDQNFELAFPQKKQLQVRRLIEFYQSISSKKTQTARSHFVAVSSSHIEPYWDVFQL